MKVVRREGLHSKRGKHVCAAFADSMRDCRDSGMSGGLVGAYELNVSGDCEHCDCNVKKTPNMLRRFWSHEVESLL